MFDYNLATPMHGKTVPIGRLYSMTKPYLTYLRLLSSLVCATAVFPGTHFICVTRLRNIPMLARQLPVSISHNLTELSLEPEQILLSPIKFGMKKAYIKM